MSEPIIADEESESNRVSLQVTSLSTQIIDLVGKQSRLEEQLLHQKKENEQLRKKNQELEALRSNYNTLKADQEKSLKLNQTLGKKLEDETKEKAAAKEEVSKLQSEVEELSASLFDEANKMVSTARKKAHDIGLRNERLISQLKEKDLLMENLQNQLKELKTAILDRDDDSSHSIRNSIIDNKSSSNLDLTGQTTVQIAYTPIINAIRFDLKFYTDFKRFVADLKYIESIKDTNTKFLKKLVADDVEPALRIDSASGIGWLSKRSLMTAFIEGRVIIEPVSGINETYRINFQSNRIQESDIKSNLYTYPAHSPPVAIEHPCAVCGEDRNDILEHSRLYILKVHAPRPTNDSSSTTASTPTSPVIAHQYALCSACLFKVRSACELFAFLRSLKTKIWKLDNEISIRKAWLELSRLRAKLFWSKVGIWDLESNIHETKIYPGTDDAVYRMLVNTEAPKPDPISNNSSASQERTLSESFGLQTPSVSNYKSSPLIRQVSAEDITSTKEPENPVALKEPATVLRKSPTINQAVNSTEVIPEVKTTDADAEASEDDDDITNDILNDYSQDEEEEEEEQDLRQSPARRDGLLIQTERPQDSILESDEDTPIVGQQNKFDAETPTEADPGFSFSPEDTKASVVQSLDADATPVVKKTPSAVMDDNDERKDETTDEEEFVDA